MTKKTITKLYETLYNCKIETLMEYVEEAKKEGFKDLRIGCEDMSDRYDNSPYYRAVLIGERLETDDEYANRLRFEDSYKAAQEEREKAQYEALKRKFEGKT